MNVTLFTVPLIIVVAAVVFRGRLPHIGRSLHQAQHEFRHGPSGPSDEQPPAATTTDQAR